MYLCLWYLLQNESDVLYNNPPQCIYLFYHVRQHIHAKFHKLDNVVSCCHLHEGLGLIDSWVSVLLFFELSTWWNSFSSFTASNFFQRLYFWKIISTKGRNTTHNDIVYTLLSMKRFRSGTGSHHLKVENQIHQQTRFFFKKNLHLLLSTDLRFWRVT